LYNPRWYKEARLEVLQAEVEKIGFGTLVTNGKGGLRASHIPMMIDKSSSKKGTLFGHIARGNAQWREAGTNSEGLAIFLGPDAYITPRWYQTTKDTGEVVPTWNYVAIHVRGPISFFDNAEKLRVFVTKLTRRYEDESEGPWRIEQAPPKYINTELKLIVGFEMPIASIEGKWKLSQNRSKADREGVKKGLKVRGGPRDEEVLGKMKGLP
jgi:transcriptional regulator